MAFETAYFGDGTGAVAKLKEALTDTSETTGIDVDDVRHLHEGVTYELYDSNPAGTSKGFLTVSLTNSAYASSMGTIALSANNVHTTGEVDDLICLPGSYGRAPSGLGNIIGTGDLQGVSVSAVPKFTSYVLAVGGALEPTHLRKMLAALRVKTDSDSAVSGLKFITEPYVLNELEEMYEGDFRFTSSDKTVGMAVTSFQSAHGKVALESSNYCTLGTVYAVQPSEIVCYEQKPLGFVKNGNGIFLQSHTSAKATAVMEWIGNFRVENRNALGKLTGISTDRDVAW
jgi:hypothetical protein